MFEFIEIIKESEFNPLAIQESAPFAQGLIYGKWQEMSGRKVRRFEIKQGEEIIGLFQIIKYQILLSKNILYIPHASILRQGFGWQSEFLKEFHEKLVEIGKEEDAIFIRFDVFPKTEENLSKYFKKVPEYAYHSFYFQPKFEWHINITKTEDGLLNEMHSKTRYNIGLSERKGVKVEIVKDNFEKYFNDFYELIEKTAQRDKFSLHPKNYYKNIFETLNSENAFLAIAKYNGKILAINLILLYGNIAHFIFGGSSDEYKNLMAPHLAHWKSIEEAKNRGFSIYNLGAVNSGGFEGISRFKKGFGGEFFEYSDSYDLVLKPIWYYLYNLRKWVLNLK